MDRIGGVMVLVGERLQLGMHDLGVPSDTCTKWHEEYREWGIDTAAAAISMDESLLRFFELVNKARCLADAARLVSHGK